MSAFVSKVGLKYQLKSSTTNSFYLAIKKFPDGSYVLCSAKKQGSRWLIAGDYDTTKTTLIAKNNGRWGYYFLKGNRMVFNDYLSDRDIKAFQIDKKEADPAYEIEYDIIDKLYDKFC